MHMQLETTCHSLLADLTSPTAVYMRLRDRYPHTFLLESGDYRGADDCRSFICCEPIAELRIEQGICSTTFCTGERTEYPLQRVSGLAPALQGFLSSFTISSGALPKGVSNGAFGYLSWDSIEYSEAIEFQTPRDPEFTIPEARFFVFRYILAFNHFRNEVHILENRIAHEDRAADREEFLRRAFHGEPHAHPFTREGDEVSVTSDEDFLEFITTCQRHIARGDVFQIVPSRRYLQRFQGDDFQVYRALRSINPSPYLFYCDFGGYRLFGSSPEAQIIIRGGKAGIFPIAGTYPRSGDDTLDRERAQQLLDDPKEVSEHAMLVDLARNDLSRHCLDVHVEKFKEVQYFSHVIHLVSHVVGTVPDPKLAAQLLCESFPLGTLSGAPKHRAMQLLDQYEPVRRGQYGGCVGLLGFDGDVVMGIIIRSFLSKQNTLVYQAGMGVVYDSVPESELNEGHHKLRALRAAMARAEGL